MQRLYTHAEIDFWAGCQSNQSEIAVAQTKNLRLSTVILLKYLATIINYLKFLSKFLPAT